MELYRPTGLKELELVYDSGMRAWPPRLPEQPIFYPVLNRIYAEQIAKEWNTKEHSKVGFVTKFNVNDNFISKYQNKIVGSKIHEELWIPAEDLNELNKNIEGQIQVIDAFFGENYTGFIPENYLLKNKNADDQYLTLAELFDLNGMDFQCEINNNNKAVYLNWLYWKNIISEENVIFKRVKKEITAAILKVWESAFPNLKLPNS